MSLLSGLEHIARENEPLAPYTWLRLGGPAAVFAEPNDRNELAELVSRAREEDLPVRLIGGGSNLLVRDEGVPGVVIRLSTPAFCGIETSAESITVGGGCALSHLISTAVGAGLSGLEALVGIPGTVGGALRTNAENYGVDIGQCIQQATLLTRSGEILVRRRDEMQFAYRQSNFDELVTLDAQFRLEPEDRTSLARRMQKNWILKQAGQPAASANSAFIFKDPRAMTAAELIEQASLKGTRVGGAEISEKNANYIVAGDGCTASDVLRLIDLVRSQVNDRLGVELENGIKIW